MLGLGRSPRRQDPMGQISEARLQLVRGLIEQAPDGAVHSLATALGAAAGEDLTRVRSLVEAEAADRSLRNRALAPIAPLCAGPNPFVSLAFPARTLPSLWRGLRQTAAELVDAAKDGDTSGLDALYACAAEGLRADRGAFAPAAA